MNRKFRFHVVDMPYTISDGSMPINPFSEKMIKFCKFMKNRGHQIFHYGHKDSKVDCDVSVNIFDRNDWERFWPQKNGKTKIMDLLIIVINMLMNICTKKHLMQ